MDEKAFDSDALDRLKQLDWRGNVRELNNVVERLAILSEGVTVGASDVQQYVQPGGVRGGAVGNLVSRFESFSDFRDEAEKVFIKHKLVQFEWNISKTAEAIGIQRSHLYNKMKKYGIER